MVKKYLIVAGFCFSGLTLLAQAERTGIYNKEIAFTTENDAYLLNKADAYYTNGLFFRETIGGFRKDKKIVTSFELGQMIYTPLIRLTESKKDVDRPYCGYLFAKMSKTQFNKDAVLQYGASLGTIGPSSFGEDVQNGYHSLLNYGRFRGWRYQVQDALGVDLNINYARTIAEDSTWLKIMPAVEAQLGSTFTNAKVGVYTCLGNFAANSASALWNARVQKKGGTEKEGAEFFFYWYPQVILQGYNATVEGGLFSKGNDSAVLGVTKRLMFQQTLGLCFAKARWTAKLAYIYQTREAVTQTREQQYVSIQTAYRIH